MRRNWDTIREILLKAEEIGTIQETKTLKDFAPEHATEIAYHVELLIEAGLVQGQVQRNIGPGPYDFWVERLTWSGHELLDSIRSATVWEKTKKSFVSQGLSMTYEVVKSIAADVAVTLIKTGGM